MRLFPVLKIYILTCLLGVFFPLLLMESYEKIITEWRKRDHDLDMVIKGY